MNLRADIEPDGSLTYRPNHTLDIGFAVIGAKTIKRRSGVYWWTTVTPQGTATVAFRGVDGCVRADGWGSGLDWAFTQLPAVLGANDAPEDFRPDHPLLRDLVANHASVRLGATGRWYEALATATIGQRVVKADASASRSLLAERFGETSPVGPSQSFPTPGSLLRLTDGDFHRVGIERSRARVVRIAAKYADRVERLDDLPAADATDWLQRLSGIGPWTAALTTSVAGGDPDAVPVGDLHIPGLVTYALTGERGNDHAMLEALEPFAGHRQRVVRLLKMSGAGPPRHQPAPFRYDISQL